MVLIVVSIVINRRNVTEAIKSYDLQVANNTRRKQQQQQQKRFFFAFFSC